MIEVTLSNGTKLRIDKATKVVAWKSQDANESEPYYAKKAFEGSVEDGTQIATSNPTLGLSGLIASTDWFSIDSGRTMIKCSSVVSIELTD